MTEENSPLQRQVKRVAELIGLVAIGLGLTFFAIGSLVAGLELTDAGTIAIGPLVANVPEALLPTIPSRSRSRSRSACAGWPSDGRSSRS